MRTIAKNHRLIRSMARRDILARYRGSFGDVFWTVLNPLLLMATYFFVFGVVLRTRFGRRSKLHRIRALFSGWDAAVAGFLGTGRTRAARDSGASQFRQEADFSAGDVAGEPGGGGIGDGSVRRRGVSSPPCC